MRVTCALASSLVLVAWSAEAADLSTEYNFIQDNAPPAPTVVGHLELGAGWFGFNSGVEGPRFEDQDLGIFEGWGRANIPFHNGFNFEAETGGFALFDGDSGGSISNIGAFGHLWYGPNGYRVGAFGGVGFGSFWTGVAGLEGEVDVGNLTLGVQGSYNFTDEDVSIGPANISNDYWGVRGWAEFYVKENTKIAGEIGWWQTEDFLGLAGKGLEPEEKGPNLVSAAASVEHRLSGRPVSLFARAEYVQTEGGDFSFPADNTVSVFGGIRIFMDGAGTTLQEHDHQVPFDVRSPALVTTDLLGFIGGQSLPN